MRAVVINCVGRESKDVSLGEALQLKCYTLRPPHDYSREAVRLFMSLLRSILLAHAKKIATEK